MEVVALALLVERVVCTGTSAARVTGNVHGRNTSWVFKVFAAS
jgi:hypothetical protein